VKYVLRSEILKTDEHRKRRHLHRDERRSKITRRSRAIEDEELDTSEGEMLTSDGEEENEEILTISPSQSEQNSEIIEEIPPLPELSPGPINDPTETDAPSKNVEHQDDAPTSPMLGDQSHLQEVTYKVPLKSQAQFDDQSKKMTFQMKPNEYVQIFSDKLQEIIGMNVTEFPHGLISNTRKRSSYFQMQFPAYFELYTQQLHIYSNIVTYSHIGNTLAPLIRMVDLRKRVGEIDNLLYRRYDRPQFYKVNSGRIKEIEIKMCDTLGRIIHIQTGISTVNLVFRRRRK